MMAGSNPIILNESVNDMRNVEYLCSIISSNHFGNDKEFYQTKKYLDKFFKNQKIKIEYKPSCSSPYGRLYGNGIQHLSREVRGFLCYGLTTDMDFKNMHPTILYYICMKHDIN